MEKISNSQLFVITVLFQIGTTIIFGFASTAGRDAWLAVLISTAIGTVINILYVLLMRMNPGMTLVEWYPAQLGKWVGIPIAWMYPLLILYDAGRGLSDLKFLVPITILPRTPMIIVLLTFVLVMIYGIFSGIEVIGRLGEIFLPIIFLLFILEIIFIFSSDIMNVHNLQPVAGKGWKPIWNAIWPLSITQSFAETIDFAMIWPLVKEPEKIMKTTVLATVISGLFITTIDAIAVAVLGEGIFKNSIYPLYTLIQQIRVGNFIENLDAIGVIYFLTTSFFKISIHVFVAVRAIQKLTLVPNSRVFVLPAGGLVLYLGMSMASNVSSHIEAGLKILPYNLWVPLFLVLPAILFIITLVRRKLAKNRVQLKN